MIGCLISLLIAAIVILIVLLIVEYVLAQFVPLTGQVIALIRLLCGLLLLLYFLECVLGNGGFAFPRHWNR